MSTVKYLAQLDIKLITILAVSAPPDITAIESTKKNALHVLLDTFLNNKEVDHFKIAILVLKGHITNEKDKRFA